MRNFEIKRPNQGLDPDIRHKIDFKTKPVGALGQLESLAQQICQVQQTLTPMLNKPTLVVFAADHGLAREGVSAYPQEVTHQMVLNFLSGGAAINVFCDQHQIDLKIVDAGVNFDFGHPPGLIEAKVGMGTQNTLKGPAMTKDQLNQAIEKGADVIKNIHAHGSNIIGFGEMGIGNTSAASLIMSHICQMPVEDCVGRGTGVDDEGWLKKVDTLKQVQAKHGDLSNISDVLSTFGGFEIAMMTGAMLEAAQLGMIILIDGFIATAAYLVAEAIHKNIKYYAIFCHQSEESGHQKLLNYLKVVPILNMNLRLGEGTGCALAYPLIQSAVGFMNQMASFENAGVSGKNE